MSSELVPGVPVVVGSTKRPPPSKHWLFTLNNPSDEEADALHKFCGTGGSTIKGYVYQLEKGEEGTPHFQGYLHFHNKVRALGMISKKCHWEKCRSPKHSMAYCQKDESRVQGPWLGGCCRRVRPLSILQSTQFYEWQHQLAAMLDKPADDRGIIWIYDEEGCNGKTAFARARCANHGAMMCGGKAADILYGFAAANENAEGYPDCVFINVPRIHGNRIAYSACESLKDGIYFRGKYESKMEIFNPPHVVILANALPIVESMTKDRWKVFMIASKMLRELEV